ncbi:unnamed protein product [Brassica oleracea]|nr:unnamed protein product [Brassica oleracea]
MNPVGILFIAFGGLLLFMFLLWLTHFLYHKAKKDGKESIACLGSGYGGDFGEVLRTITCQFVIRPLFCVSLSSPSSVKSSVHLLRRFRCGEDPEQSKLRVGLDSAIVREKPNIKWTDVAAVLHR